MEKRILLIILLFIFARITAQETENQSLLEPVSETIQDLSFFEDDTPLNLTLKYDITSFIKNKFKEDYLDAEFILHFSETDSIVKNIRLRARGNFRKGHCFFPPIYLNFKSDPIQNSDLDGINKVKLVTHCTTSKTYHYYIFREYLAYRIYNLLSDNSLRVKLVNINYIDTGKKGRNYKEEGFLIEPMDLLAKRTNSIEIDPQIVKGSDVKDLDMDRVAIFEYLIANSDWRVKTGHNMKYIKSLEELTTQVIPVPYDFDYSGFVNASYAIPQEWTSLKTVTEREYLGYCRRSDDNILEVINQFLQKKDEIYSLINDFQPLSEKEKSELLGFVNDFYGEADSPEVLLKILKSQCKDINFKP